MPSTLIVSSNWDNLFLLKMRSLFQWCIIAIIHINSVSSQCPVGEHCTTCTELPNRIYEVRCQLIDDPSSSGYIVRFKPYKWMDVICNRNPDWSTFHLGKEQQIVFIESISFKGCHIPESRLLAEIVRQITQQEVIELFFESSDNATKHLERRTLNGFKEINKLVLTNNSLTEVPVDLLHDLVNLKHFNISWNLLRLLPTGFLDIPSLEILDLSNNEMEIIQPSLFNKLQNLKTLNLKFNKLTKLASPIFDALASLIQLNIADNDLEELPSNIFKQLKTLKIIDLSGNRFTNEGIPSDLFRNNSHLQSITLTDNKQQLYSLPDKLFDDLNNLKTVFLDGNRLARLSKDLFTGAINLRNISLARNEITELPEELLKDCDKVEILQLSHNRIVDLPNALFKMLSQLEVLDVSSNYMREFNNKILDGLLSLRVLNLANNQLEDVRGEGFCVLLNLSTDGKKIGDILLPRNGPLGGPWNWKTMGVLTYCARNIQQMFLHGNRFTDIDGDWFYSEKLELITLHDNRMPKLSTYDLAFYTNNVTVTYGGNHIETISFDDKGDFKIYSPDVKVDMGSNPMNCDCRLHNLLLYRDGLLTHRGGGKLSFDMKQLRCAKPEELKYVRIENLDRMALKCLVTDPGVLNATCPKVCQCWKRPEDRGYLIDCSYRKLTKAPVSLQAPEGFHIELNLTGNQITKMPSMMQSGYHNVTKLILSKNSISSVTLDSLSNNLKTLILNSNNLTKLEADVMSFMKNSMKLMHLELHGNPWLCNCDTVDFLKFIQAKIPKIQALQKVTCERMDYSIFKMVPEDICPIFLGSIILVGIIVAILGIFFGAIAAIYYRYQHEIKVWLYAKQCCLWFVTEDELDKDKEYDAFVSFSHMDHDFVANTLVPTLEQGSHPFRLCVHYRDWIPGEPIPSQIVHSVENSKRTIVILSPNFIESIWSRIEFRAAHEQALNEGRARVIIIIHGEINVSMENLDTELKAYLKTNTYVKWGDPWFWEKLKYALGHPDNWMRKIKDKTSLGVDVLDHKMHYVNEKTTSHNISSVNISEINLTT